MTKNEIEYYDVCQLVDEPESKHVLNQIYRIGDYCFKRVATGHYIVAQDGSFDRKSMSRVEFVEFLESLI